MTGVPPHELCDLPRRVFFPFFLFSSFPSLNRFSARSLLRLADCRSCSSSRSVRNYYCVAAGASCGVSARLIAVADFLVFSRSPFLIPRAPVVAAFSERGYVRRHPFHVLFLSSLCVSPLVFVFFPLRVYVLVTSMYRRAPRPTPCPSHIRVQRTSATGCSPFSSCALPPLAQSVFYCHHCICLTYTYRCSCFRIPSLHHYHHLFTLLAGDASFFRAHDMSQLIRGSACAYTPSTCSHHHGFVSCAQGHCVTPGLCLPFPPLLYFMERLFASSGADS